MTGGSRKRSLTLRGHRTSVSLEGEFWLAFRNIAAEKGLPLNRLAADIDAGRDVTVSLASAIRLHVLRHYSAGAGGAPSGQSDDPGECDG